jgi:hypothetical protein
VRLAQRHGEPDELADGVEASEIDAEGAPRQELRETLERALLVVQGISGVERAHAHPQRRSDVVEQLREGRWLEAGEAGRQVVALRHEAPMIGGGGSRVNSRRTTRPRRPVRGASA